MRPAPHPPSRWRMSDSATKASYRAGTSPHEVLDLLSNITQAEPLDTDPSRSLVITDSLALVVAIKRPPIASVVIHVMRASDWEKSNNNSPRATRGPRAARMKGKSGGPGRTIPSTSKELLALVKAHGMMVQTRKSGHLALWLDENDPRAASLSPGALGTKSRPIIVAATPGDRRSYRNSVAQVRRATHIDLTGPVGTAT